MLDDERLAKIYAGDLMRVKFYGPKIVRGKLYEKGIARDIAENALRTALEDNGGEVELCRKCLEKKIELHKRKGRCVMNDAAALLCK